WGELTVTLTAGPPSPFPNSVALGAFAPEFGWDHKEFMRNGAGFRRIMNLGASLKTVPWSWRVTPDHKIERVSIDATAMDAALRESSELTRPGYEKMAIKPVKVDYRARPAISLRPSHDSGTARAGANRETSVCSSDFDCHDIDHLLFTSSAS